MRVECEQQSKLHASLGEEQREDQREQPCEDSIDLDRHIKRQADQEPTTEIALVNFAVREELANHGLDELGRFRCEQLLFYDHVVPERRNVEPTIA